MRLTRNQVHGNVTGVRIPPSPPGSPETPGPPPGVFVWARRMPFGAIAPKRRKVDHPPVEKRAQSAPAAGLREKPMRASSGLIAAAAVVLGLMAMPAIAQPREAPVCATCHEAAHA